MNNFDWTIYSAAIPEMFMGLMILVSLLFGAFSRNEETAAVNVDLLSKLTFLGTIALIFMTWESGKLFAFPRLEGEVSTSISAMYVLDDFGRFIKIMVLTLGLLALYVAPDYLYRHKINKFEYPILYMISILGMMIMVSAADLLMLYIGLEMMSFALYILVAFQRKNLRSSEAGLKYFVLGSMASGILLYGMSLFYGVSGTTSFMGIQEALSGGFTGLGIGSEGSIDGNQIIIAVAMVMMLTGLLFKISAVPFHMWTPDVYEGAPTPVTAFMAVVPKLAAFAVLLRVLNEPLLHLMEQWIQIIVIVAVLTMAVGSLMAIVQDNLKRLLAYSSIGHVGFAMVSLVAYSEPNLRVEAVQATLFYLTIYAFMTLGMFAILLALRDRNIYVEKISDLSGLGKNSPVIAFLFMIFAFSLAGVPPFAGFFAKFYAFKIAVEAGYIELAIVGVLFSVIAAYYCLRLLKAVYFTEGITSCGRNLPFNLRFVIIIMAFVTVLLGIFPQFMADAALIAAQGLF